MDKLKKISPKKMMLVFNIVFMVCLVSLMTMANLIIDPNHFSFWSWLTSTLILVGIQIPSIVLGEIGGKDRQMELDGGMYQMALDAYLRALDSIKEFKIFFSQFFWWFRKQETFNNRLLAMAKVEIDGQESELIIRYLDKNEVSIIYERAYEKTLDNGKVIKFKKISCDDPGLKEERIERIKDILSGKFDVKDDSYSYYLFADADKDTPMSILQRGAYLEDMRHKNLVFNRVLKPATMVIFSLVWSCIAIDTSQGVGTTQMWLNLVSRFTSMIAGFTSGWFTSVQNVKNMASELDTKSDVLTTFKDDYNNKLFVPKLYDQEVDDQLEEQKKQEEESKKNVVVPESVSEGVKNAPLQIPQGGN